jgi:RNA ligase (TIGR02306 family)
MNRKLASVQTISAIEKIPNADNILLAKILGWQVIIAKKDKFKIGDKVCFFEIDALLPDIPQFAFMAKYKFRVKTLKMKRVLSQGLCMPLSAFALKEDKFNVGDDLTNLLGVTKFELPPDIRLRGEIANYFPSFVPKTDQPRLQSHPAIIADVTNVPLAITVKMDGSSFTAFQHAGHFGVCSRNIELKYTASNTYWKIAKQYDLETKLKGLNLAIQGEICGPKINGNNLGLTRIRFFVFDIYNITSGKYLDFENLKEVCNRLELPMVPIVMENFVASKNFELEDWIKLAKGKYESGKPREGIVAKSMTDRFCTPLQSRTSFKIIAPDFLLKNES